MTPAQAFGKVLKHARKTNGSSQEQLALNCDLDRTFISLLERGQRQPTLTSILSIAKTLQTPADELIKQTTDLLSENST